VDFRAHFNAAKKELVALVNSYATRVYDEDIKMSQDLGGNNFLFIYLCSGFEGICDKLRVDPKIGLTGKDFNQRTENFGNNFRAEPVAKSWF